MGSLFRKSQQVIVSKPNPEYGVEGAEFRWKVEYKNPTSISLSPDDVELITSNQNCDVEVVGEAPDYREVVVSGCEGNGHISLSINKGSGIDQAGKAYEAVEQSHAALMGTFNVSIEHSKAILKNTLSENSRHSFEVKMDSELSQPVKVFYEVLSRTNSMKRAGYRFWENKDSGSITIPAGQTTGKIEFDFKNIEKEKSEILQIGITKVESEYFPLMMGNRISQKNFKYTGPAGDPNEFVFKQVATGIYHSCALNLEGFAYCWGDNKGGALGTGLPDDIIKKPRQVLGDIQFSKLVLGTYTCGIALDGEVYCWGDDSDDLLGFGDMIHTFPIKIISGEKVLDLSIGSDKACYIKESNQELHCWGDNTDGALGLEGAGAEVQTPMRVGTGQYQKVSVGESHVCAIGIDGYVYCWGVQEAGFSSLGVGSADRVVSSPLKVQIDTDIKFKEIASAIYHTCAISLEDSLYCWGLKGAGNPYAVDNDLDIEVIANPQEVNFNGEQTFKEISTNYIQTCAIASSGAIYYWGLDQGGTGALAREYVGDVFFAPEKVNSDTDFVSVSTNMLKTCALKSSGSVYCWGDNDGNVLGVESDDKIVHRPMMVRTGKDKEPEILSLATGSKHTCAIRSIDKKILCWGDNESGQLGTGDNKKSLLPIHIEEVPGVSGYKEVAAYDEHTCALTIDGNIYCWGSDISGEQSVGKVIPTIVSSTRKFKSLKTGRKHACAIGEDDKIYCWGQQDARLGSLPGNKTIPTKISNNESYTQIFIGNKNSCGITTDSFLRCWGVNDDGALGSGNSMSKAAAESPQGWQTKKVKSVAMGAEHTCAILENGDLYCWGRNQVYQFGITGSVIETSPKHLKPGQKFEKVYAGGDHTCVIDILGETECWGFNLFGETGILSTFYSNNTKFQGETFSYFSLGVSAGTGQGHACAILSNDGLKCWGSNVFGQLGIGEPSQFESSSFQFKKISAGYYHTCAIDFMDKAYCWGLNNSGAISTSSLSILGIGKEDHQSLPYPVATSLKFKDIKPAALATCGLTTSDEIYCWGANEHGLLGIGTHSSETPLKLDSPYKYKYLEVGFSYACAIRLTGELDCWGSIEQNQGQLIIVSVGRVGADLYQSVSIGDRHACAVNTNDQVFCWGQDVGDLIDGSNDFKRTPVLVSDVGMKVKDVQVNSGNTCYIDSANQLYCWGNNNFRQLENSSANKFGTLEKRKVLGETQYTEVILGNSHICGRTIDNKVICRGNNIVSQIGYSLSKIIGEPTLVELASGIRSLSSKALYTCALALDNRYACWGDDMYGKLGDGRLLNSESYINLSD